MNHTKKIPFLALILLALVLGCSNDDDTNITENTTFVRFNFLANSNNEPLVNPLINSGLLPKESFTNNVLKTLKIPVTLSSKTLNETVTVNYSISTNANSNLFSVAPINQVSFENTQLTDTIYINFNERWENTQNITLKLESASNPSIAIGNLNNTYKNDVFTVNLEAPNTTYTFPKNRIEIAGNAGEEINFKVNFPNGFIPSEVENLNMFEFLNGFDYTLTLNEMAEDRTFINYTITLNESIDNDNVYYQTIVTLQDTELYSTVGNNTLQIVKPIKTNRDVSVNTASNFYNASDQFHRTYGEHWNDSNNDGVCDWQGFFAFTYPVVVDENDENAVLFNDNGTPNTDDDIYHHAFKIGFNATINPTATTNAFNFKRWFNGESISSANSPGFNVQDAIEFFPENGNSNTKGNVIITPQFITISSSSGTSYSIAISGEGTYEEIEDGLFEIVFTLNATNDVLFGGTVSSEYRIYNNNSYTDPEPLTNNNCITDYDL
ncbi:hypothetical protein FUA26_09470 [Seonamhaeicola algicola]|uniref:Uncharacterized protein n=1 Tax=Seonamhaeicola algicola TaxID=1719036 RepID=A0A5C7AM76_9FLAO|nr:hypothetical protein [Seonamhaeicola algicola]TXE09708.1 hypothetical protein FUA26_09470 [Seonamhaeicola algicola]